MPDRSLIEDALDGWEDLRAEGAAIPIEQFVAEHCVGWPSEDIAALLKKAAALERADRQFRAQGFEVTPGNTSAAPDDQAGSRSLARGVEPIPGYRLRSRLGRGGFGEVWEASAPGEVAVALKFVRLHSAAGEAELKALDVIRAIHHPNLLSVHGAWQQDGFLIVAMDLAERTLLDRFREAVAAGNAGIPAEELLGYMDDAAKGIDFLNRPIHRVAEGRGGIQHRDIKPQNLLLVGGCVRVADFGLSRFLEHSVASHSGGVTPHYAAPEFFDRKTSERSDQYSLAVTYCQLRGGRLPFGGDSVYQVIYAHINNPPDLSGIPECERAVVARALAKRPEDRWPSCDAFVRAIAKVARTGGDGDAADTDAPASGMPAETVSASGEDDHPPGIRTTQRRRWRSVGLVAVLGALAVAVVSARFTPRPAAAPSLIDSKAGVRLVLIPVGEYMMGSPDSDDMAQDDERPQHLVRITEPFYLGATEVTVGQYRRFVHATGYRTEAERDGKGGYGWDAARATFEQSARYSWRDPGFAQTDQHPVVNVTWNDAVAFCDYLSRLEGLKPFDHLRARGPGDGPGYRLPTEAEWEYACRAGTRTRYACGDDPHSLATVGNIADGTARARYPGWNWAIPAEDGYVTTAPVGQFRPNAFGLHDMHGNVWEWCWDGFAADYYARSPGADPRGNPRAAQRVNRGAGWYDAPRFARSAARDRDAPGFRDDDVGFRVARSRPGR